VVQVPVAWKGIAVVTPRLIRAAHRRGIVFPVFIRVAIHFAPADFHRRRIKLRIGRRIEFGVRLHFAWGAAPGLFAGPDRRARNPKHRRPFLCRMIGSKPA
jgi:hypothetical protein